MNSVNLAPTPTAELELSGSVPFGNHDFIARGLCAIYISLLAHLSDHSPAARSLLRQIGSVESNWQRVVLRDSLLRRTIEDGVCRVMHGVETIDPTLLDELLLAAAQKARTPTRTLLNTGHCVPLSSTSGYGHIWVDDAPDGPIAQRFRAEILKRLPGFTVSSPTQAQAAALTAGVRLARQVAPNLARSGLAHNVMVVIGSFRDADYRFSSATVPGLPGVIFLHPNACSKFTDAAEAILHESLHLKFLDIDYTSPLFAPGFRPEQSPQITPHWHMDRPELGNWPVDRVLTSMHVYLSMAVFHNRIVSLRRADTYNLDECAARATECKERATWLCAAAQNHLEHLSAAGQHFLAWVGTVLATFEINGLPLDAGGEKPRDEGRAAIS